MAKKCKFAPLSLIDRLLRRKAPETVCSLFAKKSHTCGNGGGRYCGKYRMLAHLPKLVMQTVVAEPLVLEA